MSLGEGRIIMVGGTTSTITVGATSGKQVLIAGSTSTGTISTGKTSVTDTTAGFWLGNNNADPEFSVGDATEFIKLLDEELTMIKNQPSREIVSLGKNTTKFINDIIPGIHSLKVTYSECIQLNAKIDSIILILLDFNNDFRKESKCCCQRKRAKSFDIQ